MGHPALATLAAAAIWLMLPPAVQAQTPPSTATATAPATKSKYTVAELAKVLQNAGYRADIPTGGSPRISTGMSGYKVNVYLYSCDGDAGCGSLEFSMILTKSDKMTLSLVDKWNQEKRYAKAYLDTDGDLNLEYDVSFVGGVTTQHIVEAAGIFEALLPALDQFLNKPPAENQPPAVAPAPGAEAPAPRP
jgi:hypothetical protein